MATTQPTLTLDSVRALSSTTLRVHFTAVPFTSSTSGANDALNPANWTLIAGSTNILRGEPVDGDPQSVDLTLSSPLASGTWTLSVANIQTPFGIPLTAPVVQTFTYDSSTDLAKVGGGGATNDGPEAFLLDNVGSDAFQGLGWESLIAAIATGDQINWQNAKSVFDQKFKISASGKYLNRKMSDEGTLRPASMGLSDESFRKLGIKIKSAKLTRQSILDMLEVLYTPDAVRAWAQAANSEPYSIATGDDLQILLDERTTVTITFNAGDFAVPSAATAFEVGVAITRYMRLFSQSAFCNVYTDPSTSKKYLRIYSGASGLGSAVRIMGGKTQNVFSFPTPLSPTLNSPWTVTNLGTGVTRFSESGGADFSTLRIGDYVNIYGSFNANNKGSWKIINVSTMARTNICTQSQTFDDAAWSKSHSTITANSSTAPDGTVTGDKLIEDNQTNTHRVFNANFSATGGSVYTASVYAKPAGRNRIRLFLGSTAFSASNPAVFDISGGTIVSAGVGNTAAISGLLPNGWYRLSVTTVANATGNGDIVIDLDNGTGSSYLGDNVSGANLWGAQVEQFLSSTQYITTTTSAVTVISPCFDIANPNGINEEVVAIPADTLFFRPTRLNPNSILGRKLLVVSHSQVGNNLIVQLPATSLAVTRAKNSGAYPQIKSSTTPATFVRDANGTVTITTSAAHGLSVGQQIFVDGAYAAGNVAPSVNAGSSTTTQASNGSIWTALQTSSGLSARESGVGTALADGSVLITGGRNGATFNNDFTIFSVSGSSVLADGSVQYTYSWRAPSAMVTGVAEHTCVLIPNLGIPSANTNKALLAGGRNASTTTTNATALFDRTGNTWTAGPTMNSARGFHSATVLQSNKVLLCGGDVNDASVTATADLYNPQTNTIAATTGPMSTARAGHQAILLNSGKVLVIGGRTTPLAGSPVALAVCELYDPVANTFSSAGYMTFARYAFGATLLSDGRVLVAGGIGFNVSGQPANLCPNPGFETNTGEGGAGVADSWVPYNNSSALEPITPSIVAGRTGANAQQISWAVNNTSQKGLMLQGGSPWGVFGGWQPNATYLIEFYVKASGTNIGQPMNLEWNTHPILQTVVANPPLTSSFQRYAFKITWGANVETSVGAPGVIGGLFISILGSTQGTLVFDDVNIVSVLSSSEIYDPNTGRWADAGNTTNPHSYPTMAYIASTNHVVLCGNASGVTACDLFHVETGLWRTAPFTTTSDRNQASFAVLNNGTLLMTNGHVGASPVATAELFVPASDFYATGKVNDIYSIASIVNSTKFTVTSTLKGYVSNSATAITYTPLAAVTTNTNLAGPYVYDPKTGMAITSTASTFNNASGPLSNGQSYSTISLASNGGFVDAAGYIVIGYGTATQQGPIRLLGLQNSTTLLIDSSYVFTANITGGETVTLLSKIGGYAPAKPETVGSFYLTASASAMVAAISLLTGITAAGITINKVILYPGDRGLGNEGRPTIATNPKLSDAVSIWGSDSLDTDLKVLRGF